MKHYLITIEKYKDGSDTGITTFEYADYYACIKAFHEKLGQAIGYPTISSVLCVMMDETGLVHKSEVWKAPKEEG